MCVYATYNISFDAQLAKEAFAPYIVIFRINATLQLVDGQHLGKRGKHGQAWADISNRFLSDLEKRAFCFSGVIHKIIQHSTTTVFLSRWS